MSLLLLGCGYWGQNWARTLNEINALGAICEQSPRRVLELQQQYPNIPIYTQLETALQDPAIEGVVIASPAPSHFALAMSCLHAQKAVLVEKPLTLSPHEADLLVTMAEKEHLVLAVGHLMIYHPALQKLRELVHDGSLGDILGIELNRMNLGKVRNEENVWWSLAPHDLSILDMLLDEAFYPVSAHKRNLLQRPDIEDEVYAHFMTRSEISISIRVSWLSPIKRQELIITGTRKLAIFDDTLPEGEELRMIDYQFEADGQRFGGIQKGQSLLVPYPPAGNLLAHQAQAFLAKIRNQKATLFNSGESGARVVHYLANVQQMLDGQAERLAVLT